MFIPQLLKIVKIKYITMADRVSAPQSSTGLLRFYDVNSGGPQLDPRAVIIFTVVFIVLVKLIGYFL
jgi:preprotein translocase subunit Sec61beta